MVRASLHIATERFQGTILGAAVGDAMGWPYEDRARRASAPSDRGVFFEPWTKRSGGRFQPHEEHIESGGYSDDTQLIIAVARSRLCGNLWWKHLAFVEFPFWTAYSRGAGGASLRAAKLLLNGILPWESSPQDRQKYLDAGGNGVAMRVAPHALLGSSNRNFSEAATNVFADGVLTHGHPFALVGALAYAYALWLALRRTGTLEFGELLNEVRLGVSDWAYIPSIDEQWPTWQAAILNSQYHHAWHNAVNDLLYRFEIAAKGLVRGALDFDEEVLQELGCFDKRINGAGTVAAAAAVFLSSKYAVSPFEGVARAATAKGADTDTIGSMTGALVGAINGSDWLASARAQLQDHAFLAELALDLEMSEQGQKTRISHNATEAEISDLILSLSRGAHTVTLPIGTKAHICGDGGVVSKSNKLTATSWKLRDERGQTFFIKKLRKQSTPKNSDAQVNLDLPLPNGPHAKFAGISLFARDLGESRHFYCDLLGLPIKRDGQNLVALGEHLVLRQNDLVRAVGEGSIVYVDVDNIERCWKNLRPLKYAQVSLIEKKSNRPSFTCRDPDGRTVEVFQR